MRVRAVQSDECLSEHVSRSWSWYDVGFLSTFTHGFHLHGIADPSRSLNFRAKVTVAAEEEKKLIMDQDSLHGGHVAVYRQTRVC